MEVEVSPEVTPTGPSLRIRSVGHGSVLVLDPLELEGLTRLPFTPLPGLEGAADETGDRSPGRAEAGHEILRNEFAMVAVTLAAGPDGGRLLVRNMGSGAAVGLGAAELDLLSRLRHRDLAPLVDPSGLAAQSEPDPDQV